MLVRQALMLVELFTQDTVHAGNKYLLNILSLLFLLENYNALSILASITREKENESIESDSRGSMEPFISLTGPCYTTIITSLIGPGGLTSY